MELGGTEEWTSGRVVSMVDVTGSFLRGRGVGVPEVAPLNQARKASHHISMHLFWILDLCLPNFWC